MIYPNKPLYLLSLLGYIYYLTYYTLTTKDNIYYIAFFTIKQHQSLPLASIPVYKVLFLRKKEL